MARKMIGLYFLEQRESLGISQAELASVLGFSAQFMGRIEKGDVGTPEDALVKAVSFLELEPARLRKIYNYAATCFVEDLFKAAKKARVHREKKRIS